MTPREAERQVHRRARALAIVRTKGRAAKPLTVRLACVEDGGRWNATVTVHVGDEQVVREVRRAVGDTRPYPRFQPELLARLA